MADAKVAAEPYILFELDKTTYGIPSRVVQQVEMVEHITPVPNAPAHVDGVVFSRGQVIPMVSLRARFGFARISHDTRTRLIVIHADNRTVGLVVDSAREFISIPNEVIQPPPEAISGLSGKYLEGIATLGDRLVLVLNVEQVLTLETSSIPAESSPFQG